MELYKVIYSFAKGKQWLAEIKRTDIESEDKSEIYFWLRLDVPKGELEVLEFKSMSTKNGKELRVFTQGELEFTTEKADFLKRTFVQKPLDIEAKAIINAFIHSLTIIG